MYEQQCIKKVQEQLNEKFNKYIGFSFPKLARTVGINPDTLKSKLSTVKLVNKLKEFEGFNENELLGKHIESISLKTVRLKYDDKPKESMSFEQIKFNELTREVWETSKLRMKFISTTLLFVVFQYGEKEISDENLYFRGVYIWKMPLATLDNDVKSVWEKTKNLVQGGLEIKEVKRGKRTVQKNNLPGLQFNNVAHVRPKASDSSDKVLLPNGEYITKQAFWLNADYIAKVIEEMPKIQKHQIYDNEIKILDNNSIEKIKNKLIKPIYTFKEFNAIVNKEKENFEEEYFNDINISGLGYNIHPNFILVKEITKPEEYFEQQIFKQDYFMKIVDPVYDSVQFMRKLVNLENNYDVVKIEENEYITINKLNEAGIYKQDLIDFKGEVEKFIGNSCVFTWNSLEKGGFHHKLVELGFQEIFYESLLKRPGAFKYMKIDQTTFFMKTIEEFTVTELFQFVMETEHSISLDELEDKFVQFFDAFINRRNIVHYANQSQLYYSEELERLFIDSEKYYNYIE
ncbi:MutH/Sau3AI family endonuclease [Bacillus paranthracis]|uniref:MutH/Sau3AI family endonuclease n=1 Tax=Bacillus cereus group TaxID=86661 RepID=UPI0022E41A0A|nr:MULTISPECIES: MutH/Sau3AI family endonuclease [Bacillus cereus group]MDA1892726.1 MutH/Sau3AI family endonuclease [Bacillus cereus group sp. BY11-1LC]MDA2591436.1 MutH/Sau3AI family endonuclease [Bacillus cereus group sp. Bc065]MDK7443155.1 MutH/Sau3AI family endonuclease [Bacillus paranthracis]MDK7459320.1 MutH/Sau3AI family endonuclease [Bacillus paranthracis]